MYRDSSLPTLRMSVDYQAFRRQCRECGQLLHVLQFRKRGLRRLQVCRQCERRRGE